MKIINKKKMKKAIFILLTATTFGCQNTHVSTPIVKEAKTNQHQVDSLINLMDAEITSADTYQNLATELSDSSQSVYKKYSNSEATLGCSMALINTSQVFNNMAHKHLIRAAKLRDVADRLNKQDLQSLAAQK